MRDWSAPENLGSTVFCFDLPCGRPASLPPFNDLSDKPLDRIIELVIAPMRPPTHPPLP